LEAISIRFTRQKCPVYTDDIPEFSRFLRNSRNAQQIKTAPHN
jgi:hypothetical protein